MPPNGEKKSITNGILGEDEVLYGIKNAQNKIKEENLPIKSLQLVATVLFR